MRIPRLKLPGSLAHRPTGRPFFWPNPRVPEARLKPPGQRPRTVVNRPIWPDDDLRAHPDSPYQTELSEEAIRAIAVVSAVSDLGPRLLRASRTGALRVAPDQGSFLRSQEGALTVGGGATVTIGDPPATSLFIANDDSANAITFQVSNRMLTNGKDPDYSQATTQTLKAGEPPVSIDVTAYGVKLPATGNASNYRVWWIV